MRTLATSVGAGFGILPFPEGENDDHSDPCHFEICSPGAVSGSPRGTAGSLAAHNRAPLSDTFLYDLFHFQKQGIRLCLRLGIKHEEL